MAEAIWVWASGVWAVLSLLCRSGYTAEEIRTGSQDGSGRSGNGLGGGTGGGWG